MKIELKRYLNQHEDNEQKSLALLALLYVLTKNQNDIFDLTLDNKASKDAFSTKISNAKDTIPNIAKNLKQSMQLSYLIMDEIKCLKADFAKMLGITATDVVNLADYAKSLMAANRSYIGMEVPHSAIGHRASAMILTAGYGGAMLGFFLALATTGLAALFGASALLAANAVMTPFVVMSLGILLAACIHNALATRFHKNHAKAHIEHLDKNVQTQPSMSYFQAWRGNYKANEADSPKSTETRTKNIEKLKPVFTTIAGKNLFTPKKQAKATTNPDNPGSQNDMTQASLLTV